MSNYFNLLRIKQYIKNLIIFLPAFFGLKIFNFGVLKTAGLAFLGFSFVASAVYVFNDYLDIEEDRQHPRKKNRPLAAGKISKRKALGLMIVFLILGLVISLFLDKKILYLFLVYIFLNVLYSLKLKHIPILDVATISSNYIIRLFVGSFVSDVPLSMWIIIITFLLALFISLAKRREDAVFYSQNNVKSRQVLDGYNLDFLNSATSISGAVVIVSYILYTVSSDVIAKTHTQYLYLTALFVVLGILRYLQLMFVENKTGSPTSVLLKDKFIQLCVLFWLIVFGFILYK